MCKKIKVYNLKRLKRFIAKINNRNNFSRFIIERCSIYLLSLSSSSEYLLGSISSKDCCC